MRTQFLPLIALMLATAFTTACFKTDDNPPSGGNELVCGGLDGVWEENLTRENLTIKGSTNTVHVSGTVDGGIGTVNNELTYIGIKGIGNLTWSGQAKEIITVTQALPDFDTLFYYTERWLDIKLTMSADGQALTITYLHPDFMGQILNFTRECSVEDD